MAHITQQYDDELIIQALKAIRPDLNFGGNSLVDQVSLQSPTYGRPPLLRVEVLFPLTPDELQTVLGPARG